MRYWWGQGRVVSWLLGSTDAGVIGSEDSGASLVLGWGWGGGGGPRWVPIKGMGIMLVGAALM